ncbi:MAG: hypothetical protein KJO09_00100 [Gammaproteobacteria bacterium]|nr:hypothetical protein [Gammaproteobacteria bacterium]
MRGLVILGVALLVGCAPVKTLEELEIAALQSGDWSAVEMREKRLARQKQRRGMNCGSGAMAVCVDRMHDVICECMSRQDMEYMLSGR